LVWIVGSSYSTVCFVFIFQRKKEGYVLYQNTRFSFKTCTRLSNVGLRTLSKGPLLKLALKKLK